MEEEEEEEEEEERRRISRTCCPARCQCIHARLGGWMDWRMDRAANVLSDDGN